MHLREHLPTPPASPFLPSMALPAASGSPSSTRSRHSPSDPKTLPDPRQQAPRQPRALRRLPTPGLPPEPDWPPRLPASPSRDQHTRPGELHSCSPGPRGSPSVTHPGGGKAGVCWLPGPDRADASSLVSSPCSCSYPRSTLPALTSSSRSAVVFARDRHRSTNILFKK